MPNKDKQSLFRYLLQPANVAAAAWCLTVAMPAHPENLERPEVVRQVPGEPEQARNKAIADLLVQQVAESRNAASRGTQGSGGTTLPRFTRVRADGAALLEADTSKGALLFLQCAFQTCLRDSR